MTNSNTYSLVAAQARRRPDSVAIVDRRPVTYRELMRRTDRIARALTGHGLSPEAPVAVLVRRDADLVATLLAVWKVGACYVPLDLDDPPARQAHMIRAAGSELVVGTGALLSVLHDAHRSAGDGCRLDTECLDIDDLPHNADGTYSDADADADADADRVPSGDHLAYVLFTSGSTGAPKGVEVEHRSVVNLLEAARDLLEFESSDRYLAVSTIGFDISVAELFVPLITGGSLLLRDRALLRDPVTFAADIRDHGVTVAQTGPTVWSTVLAAVPDFPRLRVAISTGEAIAPSVAARLVGIADEAWNLYGPTEATVWATAHRLTGQTAAPAVPAGSMLASTVSAPIGVAVDNVRTIVVDHDGSEVPNGAQGELWLGGVALARGYRSNRALTDDRFVSRNGLRWYRTGDAVVRDAAGVLHYFGRNDDQIKVRGVRIEPMEVESAIVSVPGVRAAAATWFESSTGGRSIVAAVVVDPGVRLTPRDLHDELADTLPGPMIPSRFVFCDALPRSPSGKIDRVAIRALDHDRAGMGAIADGATGEGAPSARLDATERKLIDIWQRTLGTQAVGPDDHFFTIGGDSLAAVTMMLDVEETFGVSLPIRVVFEAPTLRGLAARIDDAGQRSDESSGASAGASSGESSGEPSEEVASDYIFLLAPGTGTPFFFCGVDLKLARRGMWRADCPLYAVSQWAQGKGFIQAKSVDELARKQLDAIMAIQPHGPYRLGGFSFGGLVAYELAQMLRSRGDEVELLFLLDATEPYLTVAGPLASDVRPPLLTRTTSYLSGLRSSGTTRRQTRDVAKRVFVNLMNLGGRVPIWQWLNYQAVHLHGRHPSSISTRLVPRDRWPAYWYTSLRLAKSYVARPYDGRVAAVFLEEGERSDSWRSLLGPNLETFTLDERLHGALFDEPTVSRWLDYLRPLIP